jgi:hypothetical protein
MLGNKNTHKRLEFESDNDDEVHTAKGLTPSTSTKKGIPMAITMAAPKPISPMRKKRPHLVPRGAACKS